MSDVLSTDKQFTVILECKVIKHVTVEGCTEDQAEEDPWTYAIDEIEVDQVDWDVLEVRKP